MVQRYKNPSIAHNRMDPKFLSSEGKIICYKYLYKMQLLFFINQGMKKSSEILKFALR